MALVAPATHVETRIEFPDAWLLLGPIPAAWGWGVFEKQTNKWEKSLLLCFKNNAIKIK